MYMDGFRGSYLGNWLSMDCDDTFLDCLYEHGDIGQGKKDHTGLVAR